MENNQLAHIVQETGTALFTHRWRYPLPDAQENLSGVTHYVDSDTLKYFHSRINRSGVSCSGLIYYIIESIAANSANTKRGFRFVAFDVYGTTIQRNDLGNLSRTSEKALKDYYTWLNSFDLRAHYTQKLIERAKQAQKQFATLTNALEAIKG